MPARNFHDQNIAALATVTPIQTNAWQYQYLPWPALVEIGMIQDGAAGSVIATVSSGSDTLMEESPINAGGTDGVFPTDEQLDMIDEAAAGDLLKISARETGNVATTDLMTRVKLTPMI